MVSDGDARDDLMTTLDGAGALTDQDCRECGVLTWRSEALPMAGNGVKMYRVDVLLYSQR